jgi:hypothetical protein
VIRIDPPLSPAERNLILAIVAAVAAMAIIIGSLLTEAA